MNMRITPRKLSGSIAAIASKSDLHRQLFCAVLSGGATTLQKTGRISQDVQATIDCLQGLGAQIIQGEDCLQVLSPSYIDSLQGQSFFCGESGSTLRLLTPILAAIGGQFILQGTGRLPHRPMEAMWAALRAHGCKVAGTHLPVTVMGKLLPGVYRMPGNISSQYISGLLLALPLLNGDSEILLASPLESVGYVQLTLDVLQHFGVQIAKKPSGFFVPGKQKYLTAKLNVVQGDWSNAAFWLGAGACSEAGIVVQGLNAQSRQPDRAMRSLLQAMGANIRVDTQGICVKAEGRLRAASLDAASAPDLVPVVSVLMALADGTSQIYHASRLRWKESDRIHAVYEMLTALDADIALDGDTLSITGKEELRGGVVNSFQDHRIAMAAAVAACSCMQEVIIQEAEAVQKSYPDFFIDYQMLGGVFHVL